MKQILHKEILAAVKKHGGVYTMTVTGQDAEAVQAAVNQGIDAHLEACNVVGKDSYQMKGKQRLVCKIHDESVPVLIRRLASDQVRPAAQGVAIAMLSTLGIVGLEDDEFEIVKERSKNPGKAPTEEDEGRFEYMAPSEYASMWGCDPQYDSPPNKKGDGYKFYNYGSENTVESLQEFIPAIERTIESQKQREVDASDEADRQERLNNIEDLEALKAHVETELDELLKAKA